MTLRMETKKLSMTRKMIRKVELKMRTNSRHQVESFLEHSSNT